MANIYDVAKMAGVSASTVSIYLNNKKPLKEETARRIAAAITTLNYVVQASGRELRTKSNSDIGIVFPTISEPYLEKIISSIKGYLTQNGKNFVFELSDGDPEIETRALRNFIGRKVAGIILYTCQPDNLEVFQSLEASKIPFVLIDRKNEAVGANFVTTDNRALFYSLTRSLLQKGHKNIALVCGPQEYNENQNAHHGYLAALEEAGIPETGRHALFTSTSRESGFRAGMQLLETTMPTTVLTTGFRLAEGVRYALSIHHLSPTDDIQVITTGDSIDDVFYCDPAITKAWRAAYSIGEAAGEILLKNMKSPMVFETREAIFHDTYPENAIRAPRVRKVPKQGFQNELNVLLLDDDVSIHGLQQLLVDFYRKENVAIHIEKVLPEKAFDAITQNLSSPDSGIDVFMFDVPWLPYLAEKGFLYCIDPYMRQEQVSEKDFVPGTLERFGRFKGNYYALPYMACSQLLFYRRDLFENKELQRAYEETYMIPLEVPSSWLYFNTVAEFFTQSRNPKSPTRYGHAMSTSYPEQLICELMPRIWAYGDDICNKDGAVHLNTPKIVKAVQSMLYSVSTSEPSLFQNRPIDTVEQFIQGKTAMLSTFYNYATSIVDRLRSKVSGSFGYTSIPGNHSVLAGWSLGITRYCKKPDLAFRFLNWACGNDIAIAHTILGGQSPRTSVYRNYDLISLYPWLSKALPQFHHCYERKTPFSSAGNALNEKKAEELISGRLLPLMKDAAQGSIASSNAIASVLADTEKELKKNLR